MNSITSRNVKLCAAAIGGSAMVAFGVANVVVGQQSNDQVAATGATVGAVPAPTAATTSQVYGAPALVRAAPEMTGKAPYWPGQSPNHTPQ